MKVGDRVILVKIEKEWTDLSKFKIKDNPLWGGVCGKIKGTIYSSRTNSYSIGDLNIFVKWDNLSTNAYNEKHLSLYKKILIKEILK